MTAAFDPRGLRWAYPLAGVLAGYGVELRRRGRWLVGRCPFHEDHTPSLLVDESDQHFHCFGCAAHGDVLDLVMRVEGLDFRRALARLAADAPRARRPPPPPPLRDPRPWGTAECTCLAAAMQLYRAQLSNEPAALTYAAGRGIARATLGRCGVGFAAGGTLVAYLRRHDIPLGLARRVGLLDRRGRERFAGRIVLPELRAGAPIWLIGRVLSAAAPGPKYLGLPGRKPLLGWEAARGAAAVTVVEGVFDLLALVQWGEPALALAGTHASPASLAALRAFPRVYLAFDADAAGRNAAAALQAALGERAHRVALPGVKDVGDLAPLPDGHARFARARAAYLEAA